MKNLFFILFVLIFCNNLKGQNTRIIVPPYNVDVSNSILTQIPIPSSNSNTNLGESVFDDSNNLLFYVLKDGIYNANGQNIMSLSNPSSDGVQIVKVPNSCNEYFVITSDLNHTYYAKVIVDFSTNIVTIPQNQNRIQIKSSNRLGNQSLAVSKLNSNNERYLYVADYGIEKFIISSTGITPSNKLFANSSPLNQEYASGNKELEISKDGTKLATGNDNNIYVFNLDVNGDYLNHILYSIPNTNPVAITGLEFAKNDTELYVSNGYPNSTNLNDGINIIDLNTTPTSFFHIPLSKDYSLSYIEKINNGNLLIRSNTSLAQIDVNTRTITNGINVQSNTNNVYFLPNQIDYETTNYEVGTPKAVASFVNPDRVIQMNSRYGPGDVSILCLSRDLLVDGSNSTCEDRYFIGLSEFDLNSWSDIQILHSDWVQPLTSAPNNIKITDFLPQGYQLRPNIVYKFRLAIGIPWHSVDIFFMIDCC